MKITVFVDKPPSKKQCDMCKVLDHHFVIMVDAIHDNHYLRENYGSQCRFFFLEDFLSRCKPEELETVRPSFAVIFNEDQNVTEQQWVAVERYLEKLFFPDIRVSERTLQTAQELFQPYNKQKASFTLEQPKLPSFYEVETLHLKEQDVMLIEVRKPFCDVPYTDVIFQYSKRGFKPFFTDLFICDSWGVYRKDIEFLEYMWKAWNMEGELNLDQRLREATERCFPSEDRLPDTEPTVYRKPISEVTTMFEKREEGMKRKAEEDEWREKQWKKRLSENILD